MLHCIWIDKLCHTNRVVVEGKVIAVYGSVNKLRGRKKRSKSVDRAKCNFLFDDSPFSFAAKTSLLVVNDTQAEKKSHIHLIYCIYMTPILISAYVFLFFVILVRIQIVRARVILNRTFKFQGNSIHRTANAFDIRSEVVRVCMWVSVCISHVCSHAKIEMYDDVEDVFFFFFRFFFVRLLCVNWWR